jgi:signal transduction histidine kinase
VKISRRLLLLVSVPLAVAVTFSGLALAPATSRAIDAHRLAEMVEAAESATELVHRLQRERASATVLVTGQGDAAAFRKSAAETDVSAERFARQRDDLTAVPANAEAALERITGSLGKLAALRDQARSGSSTLSALAFRYRIVIADLIAYRERIAQAEGVEADVADRIRAAASLSRATEHLSRQQVTVLKALDGGGFTPASQRTFEATRLGYAGAVRVMFDLGPPQWRSRLERTLSGPEALTARRLEDRVGRSDPGRRLEVSAQNWQAATSDRLGLLWSVEDRVDGAVVDTVADARTSLAWWAGGEVALVLLTLVAAVAFALRFGRVLIHRLRDLRNAAHEVAHRGLPQAMTALAQQGALSGATPEQVAERSGSPVQTADRDEIDEVGKAFNAVHYEAVRLAAQRAHSHEKFADTLVGVARRGAQLTGVMVNELDQVQRDESDPERMQVWFALDHLAIRMERNTNSLLVLGGHGQGRARTADAPCSSVIVAAAQQVERFSRVSVGVVEDGIHIAARAVHDLAHLLAELLDNATRFSPPDTEVGVAAWRLSDRAVVTVVDEGIGIPPERRTRLNAELAGPRTDVGGVRSMGLHVVAQLAARYGIGVTLHESSGPGTIAEIVLPAAVLTEAPRQATPEPSAAGRIPGPTTAGVDRHAAAPEQTPRRPDTSRRTQPPVQRDPATRVGGVSASGLPVRKRQATGGPPEAAPRDTRAPQPAAAPRPSPRRRDSQQVSNVLAAYTQGVNRSARRRGRPPGRPGSTDNDDTQRST